MCFPIVKLDASKLFDNAIYKICPTKIIKGFGQSFDSRVLLSLMSHPWLIWVGVIYSIYSYNLIFLMGNTTVNTVFILWSLWAWHIPKDPIDL